MSSCGINIYCLKCKLKLPNIVVGFRDKAIRGRRLDLLSKLREFYSIYRIQCFRLVMALLMACRDYSIEHGDGVSDDVKLMSDMSLVCRSNGHVT